MYGPRKKCNSEGGREGGRKEGRKEGRKLMLTFLLLQGD
jgi:hypothetical protein